MTYETDKNTYNFQNFEKIRSFGDSIFTCKTTLNDVVKKQSNLRNTVLDSTKNKIIKGKNGEKVPHLEVPEVVLVDCNIVNDGWLSARLKIQGYIYSQ